MTEPPAAILAPPTPAGPRPSWMRLRAAGTSVAVGRRFAADIASGHTLNADYAYTVRLITSELLTNAVTAALSLRRWGVRELPIRLGVAACNRWLHLAVTDPDYRPLAASDEGGQMSEHGRGLTIVDALVTDRWIVYTAHAKTVHTVLAAPDVALTAAELAQIRDAR